MKFATLTICLGGERKSSIVSFNHPALFSGGYAVQGSVNQFDSLDTSKQGQALFANSL